MKGFCSIVFKTFLTGTLLLRSPLVGPLGHQFVSKNPTVQTCRIYKVMLALNLCLCLVVLCPK
jgi:hypothetical protein